MERLTYRTELGVSIDKNEDCPTCSACWNCNIPPRKCGYISDALKKLADYEDLEEQGRLVKLPCKVGDVVYVKMASYCKTHYVEAEVRDFVHFISCGFCAVVTSKYFDKENIPFSEFGKTIFLTKEEVEAKLKELRGGEDG
jgi:hypothetical protein|nr:MAG TPA: hypothetical protein [Caudoviricetes sp.]